MIDYSLPFPPCNKYMLGNTLCVFHWEFGTRLKTNGKNKGLKAIRVTHETSAHEGQTESSSPSSSQPHSSHCRAKASSLCHHASLPWVKRNHVGPAKATSPSLRLRRWRPFLRLPSLGLHSVAPNIDEKVDLHFIALVHVDGHLYELDGRKPFPINHGETSDETLLEDAIEVCKKFMERDPDELRFNAIALSAA
ncbi:ubiquitin carboxyl-terminal hydrolase isozyme L3 isoform X5 [Hippopotamus amphibius kiboko]|uniref:ubiquitin carboxyl-terminal hydrolase isozyme L3 isoform X5 n=1 Tax=Hippopotamus amphibius kiboko TaxID=575201 RepID=UPI002594D9A6|nr:ubiquitin carboxyl-terminal hydrolase isozyme L3 isoform X5 [Hippopotamus amphibius kiboko]